MSSHDLENKVTVDISTMNSASDALSCQESSPANVVVRPVDSVSENPISLSPAEKRDDQTSLVGERVIKVPEEENINHAIGATTMTTALPETTEAESKKQTESTQNSTEAQNDRQQSAEESSVTPGSREELTHGDQNSIEPENSKENTVEPPFPSLQESVQEGEITPHVPAPENPNGPNQLLEKDASESDQPTTDTRQSQSSDDDIEWLTPFSMRRADGAESNGKETADNEASKTSKTLTEPLKMLKKGAVAAVGGTMVGVGLVMIPLPTPFGAVVASSGLAVLGSEFDQAKELNDKLIDGAKGHLNSARDAMVKGIENMNQDDFDPDSSPQKITNSQKNDRNDSSESNEEGNVIRIDASSSTIATESIAKKNSDEDDDKETDNAPVWLHMNPIERKRQERLAKEKYRRENQTSYEQAKEAFTKRTGRFLSRNLLPLIKKKESFPRTPQTLSKENLGADDSSSCDGVIVFSNETVGEASEVSKSSEAGVAGNSQIDGGYVVVRQEDNS